MSLVAAPDLSSILPWFILIAVLKGLEPFFRKKRPARRNSSRPSVAQSTNATSSPSAGYLGWIGEMQVRLGLWLFLRPTIYRRLHNVIIPTDNGTTQIDHLLISRYGIFVIETKNIRGWIFGTADGPKWTQSLYGSK